MKTGQLKDYAPQARRDFIAAVTDRAAFYGLTADKIVEVQEKGDVAIIAGRPFPRSVAVKRKKLEEQIRQHGLEQVMEKVAYTWFNRLVAIRFMELHGYFDHGYRVLSHPEGKPLPEIVEHAEHVELPGLDQAKVIELKLDGNRESELYRLLLVAQCNALSRAMPFLFESIDDETELLLPDNLLHSDSLIRKLVESIDEEDWQEVEIIGWLYQFYISEKKAEVIGKVVKSEDIPAATQLFTPNWIVKYLVHNSLGRQWVATYPNSSLKAQMEYYIEPAEQTPEVQANLKEITPTSLNPEELTLLDPACGSGHILVEAYDLLKAIYQERGYRAKDIPRLILEKNLFGLEIDDRAAQLAAFALMMKARADDRRIFDTDAKPNILAFQDSKGMNAADITHALNSPINEEVTPPSDYLFEEIEDAKTPLFRKNTLVEKGHLSQNDIATLLELFENAKTFGSLIQVPPKLAAMLPEIEQRLNDVLTQGDLTQASVHIIKPLLQQARSLARTYCTVVANPPYLGSKSMSPLLKDFGKVAFPISKPDTFSMFIERCVYLSHNHGMLGFVTPYVWMFISSFEEFRDFLETNTHLTSLIQLEYNAFEPACVPVCCFTASKMRLDEYVGDFIKLTDFKGHQYQAPRTLEAINNPECKWRFRSSTGDLRKIPGSPIAYWESSSVRDAFLIFPPLADFADARIGMATGKNEVYVRLWHEVSVQRIGFGVKNREESVKSGKKWFPYAKGGGFRKWFGNRDDVVNWENDGRLLQTTMHPGGKRIWAHNFNLDKIFKPSMSWTFVTSSQNSFRLHGDGFLFDSAAGLCQVRSEKDTYLILGILNSHVGAKFLALLNPTLNLPPGYLEKVPISTACQNEISDIVRECVRLSQCDEESFEQCWDFKEYPYLSSECRRQLILGCAENWESLCATRAARMKQHEEEINERLISFYKFDGLLSKDVPDNQITLYHPDREEDIKRLISYAIGCMIGRFSLDKPGLIYAHSGNKGFDPSQYKTFPADRDGIIPLTDFEWFEDDTAKRFEDFIGTAWPGEHLEENLTFIAESLGPKPGESARATIRRYLATAFYKHHLSMYKRRPIYWLFSSGKQRAFQALVYLHRYNEGTLSRMRTEYVVPLLGKISARIGHLDRDITGATGKHRRDLEKEQATLRKQRAELQEYDDRLRHHADQRIALDLDDGVKVNYAKFGDLLAEVKAVTGGSDDE